MIASQEGVLKKKRVSMVHVKIIQFMYDEVRTSVKTMSEEMEDFTVKVWVFIKGKH